MQVPAYTAPRPILIRLSQTSPANGTTCVALAALADTAARESQNSPSESLVSPYMSLGPHMMSPGYLHSLRSNRATSVAAAWNEYFRVFSASVSTHSPGLLGSEVTVVPLLVFDQGSFSLTEALSVCLKSS